jgi:hypothetical protein
MILKSGTRLSEKIMLKQRIRSMIRFSVAGSWSGPQSLRLSRLALSFFVERDLFGRSFAIPLKSAAGFLRIMA